MNLVIDTRESALMEALRADGADIAVESLHVGDAVIRDCGVDLVIFERKAVADLVASIRDGRYGDQSVRLASKEMHRHNIVYIIEGRVASAGQMVLSALTSLLLYKGFSVLTTSSVKGTAALLHGVLKKMRSNSAKGTPLCYSDPVALPSVGTVADGIVKERRADNMTPALFAQIVLCQVPSVSQKTAAAVLASLGSLKAVIAAAHNADPAAFAEIKIGTRRISKSAVANILRYFAEA